MLRYDFVFVFHGRMRKATENIWLSIILLLEYYKCYYENVGFIYMWLALYTVNSKRFVNHVVWASRCCHYVMIWAINICKLFTIQLIIYNVFPTVLICTILLQILVIASYCHFCLLLTFCEKTGVNYWLNHTHCLLKLSSFIANYP